MENAIFCKLHTIVIHSGKFHADEIFVVAYLQKYFEHFMMKMSYIRTLDIKDEYTLENGYIVADIGLGKYDHHQKEEDKEHRPDGTAYAAFGLVVKYFHEQFLSEDEYELLDKIFIKDLDEHDNYGTPNHLTLALSAFNVKWNEEKTEDLENTRFDEALTVASAILDKILLKVRATIAAKEIANNAEIGPHKTIFLPDKYIPIDEFFIEDDRVEFIGFWHDRGVYAVMSIKNKNGKNKYLFPEKFRGFSSKEPNDYGMTFCHASGFLASFVNEEVAKHFMENYEF